MKKAWFVIFSILCISGCAVKPVSSFQTKNSLIVTLSGKENRKFTLVDQRGQTLSQATGDEGKLEFNIPDYKTPSGCAYIRDHKGKALSPERYKLSLIEKFKKTTNYKSKIEKQYDDQRKKVSSIYKSFQDTKIRMESHSAFSNRRCHLPSRRPLPPKPLTRCNSYDECLEEGAAICFSRFIGTEGCSLALKELNIAGMLSSPSCSAIAAELAGDKYNMEDAFVDLLHGIADDAGSNLLKSESWVDKALGLIVLGANYTIKIDKARSCTDNFVQNYYGPRLAWQQRVREIKSEPLTIKNNCENLIVKHNRYLDNFNKANANLQKLRVKFTDLSVIHDEISTRETPPALCVSGQYNQFSEIKVLKRYLIGAGVENIETKDESNAGIKIASFVNNSPAKASGLRINDKITHINNVRVNNIVEMTREVQRSTGQNISVRSVRGQTPNVVIVTPLAKEIDLIN